MPQGVVEPVIDAGEGEGEVDDRADHVLDGFTAGPDDTMDWISDYIVEQRDFPGIMAATGAMLIGRRTYDVAQRMAEPPSGEAYDGGALFVLTHEPPDPPNPQVAGPAGAGFRWGAGWGGWYIVVRPGSARPAHPVRAATKPSLRPV